MTDQANSLLIPPDGGISFPCFYPLTSLNSSVGVERWIFFKKVVQIKFIYIFTFINILKNGGWQNVYGKGQMEALQVNYSTLLF